MSQQMSQHPFKKGDRVQCLGNFGTLVKDQTYVVVGTRLRYDGQPLVMVDEADAHGFEEWYYAKRFCLISDEDVQSSSQEVSSEDPVEDRLRAALTTTSDPFTCKKCGAPKSACTYHR